MMRQIIAFLITGLFLVGVAGIVQAAGYNGREDCCTEGPPFYQDFQQDSIVPTIIIDEGPLYIEGMGFEPRPKGPKTILPKNSEKCDWCGEGYNEEELEKHYNNTNRTVPASQI